MPNLAIIQARMGSTRLPNKVLLEVNNVPLLEYEIRRVQMSKRIDKIVLATGDKPSNDPIAKLCKKIGIDCFRGSEDDVLDRYYQCALKYPAYENIIRITGDCPLIDPRIIDEVIDYFIKNKYDYASNVGKETFPDGMDVEIFKKEALAEAALKAKIASEREHVTLYIRNNKKYRKGNVKAPKNYSSYRLTVDNQEDFEVIKFLIENSQPDDDYIKFIALLEKNPDIKIKNINIERNAGLKKSLKEDYFIK